MSFNFSSNGIQYQGSGGGGGGTVVTEDGEQTLRNKTINADDNHLLNLDTNNFKEGLVRTSVRSEDEASDEKLVTEKAVACAIATFIYDQALPSDTWVIEHNLKKYPSVNVVDSAGTLFLAQVHYDSMNKITVSLNGAMTGKAYLN